MGETLLALPSVLITCFCRGIPLSDIARTQPSALYVMLSPVMCLRALSIPAALTCPMYWSAGLGSKF